MDEPRDDIDLWLSERVTPLLPHPGTFEQVRKRARRRKLGQAAIAAGGAAVIVAAAVTVPHLVIARLSSAPNLTPAGPVHPTATPHPTHSPKPAPSPSVSPSPTTSAPPPAVPANFEPSSVTFVSPNTGWVLGQAGTPGQCTGPDPNICTSLAVTFNGGEAWQGMPAPVAGPPNGAYGVSQVRSLNGTDGWVFGPQLYATHDGGLKWKEINTDGMRVTDLETVNGRAFAVWARCTGNTAEFAANCTRFWLYSTPANTNQWAPVPGAGNLTSRLEPSAGILPSSAQLALGLKVGYLLAPNGSLYSGPTGSAGGWQRVVPKTGQSTGCGLPGQAQADGMPGGAMLATTGAGLVEMCVAEAPGRPQAKRLMYSGDGGRSWQPAGYAPRAGLATSLSGSVTGQVVVATTVGIDVSGNVAGAGRGGLWWRRVTGTALSGGFSYVGMTTSLQGIAIPVDQSLHVLLFTYNGGRYWRESAVHSLG
jgi:hypothetical protein